MGLKNNRRKVSEKELITPPILAVKEVVSVEQPSFLNSLKSLELRRFQKPNQKKKCGRLCLI